MISKTKAHSWSTSTTTVVRPASSSPMEQTHTSSQLCLGNTCSWKNSCGKQLLAVVCGDVTEHRKCWLGSFVATRDKKLKEMNCPSSSTATAGRSAVKWKSSPPPWRGDHPNQSRDKPWAMVGADEVQLKRTPRKWSDLHRKQERKFLLVLSKRPDSHCYGCFSSTFAERQPWQKQTQLPLLLLPALARNFSPLFNPLMFLSWPPPRHICWSFPSSWCPGVSFLHPVAHSKGVPGLKQLHHSQRTSETAFHGRRRWEKESEAQSSQKSSSGFIILFSLEGSLNQ